MNNSLFEELCICSHIISLMFVAHCHCVSPKYVTKVVCVIVLLQGHVVMGTQAISPYQQLIDKTKNLSFRTQMLAMNIEKKANARSTEVSYH